MDKGFNIFCENNIIYIQKRDTSKNNILINLIHNNKLERINLSKDAELIPFPVITRKKFKLQIKLETNTGLSNTTKINSYFYQWVVFDIYKDTIKVKKYVFPPTFE